MVTTVQVTSDLDRITTGLDHAAASAPEIIASRTALAAETLGAAIVPVIVSHTPRKSGNLADSTTQDVAASSDGALIFFRQPAANERGTKYGVFVREGHRIVAWGHDTGRMQPPNPYADESMAEARATVIPLTLDAAGRDIGLGIIQAFGGRA